MRSATLLIHNCGTFLSIGFSLKLKSILFKLVEMELRWYCKNRGLKTKAGTKIVSKIAIFD